MENYRVAPYQTFPVETSQAPPQQPGHRDEGMFGEMNIRMSQTRTVEIQPAAFGQERLRVEVALMEAAAREQLEQTQHVEMQLWDVIR